MTSKQTVREILEWHVAAGVDETIGTTPVDRFADSTPATAPDPPPPPAQPKALAEASAPAPSPPPRAALPANGEESVRTAVELARAASNVDELRAALEGFDDCALKKTATNLVFIDGAVDARLMFIGEGPGAEEDRQGLPFVGPSGRLLDKMMASIGIDRTQAVISNTVFWRPPGNRTPTPQETAVCLPFVERLVELVDPDILVTLGGPAAKAMLGETQGVGRLRGRWFTYETAQMSHPINATAMFHPAYLLRSPAQKRQAWGDLIGIKKRLDAQQSTDG
jgi:DNA polymerase